MKYKKILSLLSLISLPSFSAVPFLERSDGALGMGAQFGTMGLGASAAVSLNNALGFRVNGNILKISLKEKNPFDTISLNIRNIGMLADFTPLRGSPFLSNIRATAGFYVNQFFIEGKSSGPRITEYVKQKSTSPDISIITSKTIAGASVNLSFSSAIAPYIGVGYGKFVDTRQKGLDVSADLGLLFIGKAQLSSSVQFANSLESNLFKNAVREIVDERTKEVENEFNSKFKKPYPVVSLGLIYRF